MTNESTTATSEPEFSRHDVVDESKPKKSASKVKPAAKAAPAKKEKIKGVPVATAKGIAKAEKAKGKEKAPARLDTGYVALIRSLLAKGKHTVSAMAEAVKEEFPDKDLNSIKRIGHNLAKKARKADPETKAKWLPGQPTNTGYMAKIDQLLKGGKLTTRMIAEAVAEEFQKDVVSAKKVVRARLKRLTKNGESLKVPLESAFKEAKPPAKAKAEKVAPKAKETPAKAAKAKAPAKKTAPAKAAKKK